MLAAIGVGQQAVGAPISAVRILTRQNLAVCPAENSFCQGCYNKITKNDVARLMGASAVVQCGSCQRILYLQS